MNNTRAILVHVLALIAIGTAGCAQETETDEDVGFTTSETTLDPSGGRWQKLGEKGVTVRNDGAKRDHDVVTVGTEEGRFDSIQLRVEGAEIAMFGVKIVFGNGEVMYPVLRATFTESSRTRIIDLPGNTRFIQRVEFQYEARPGGSEARVSLWGRHVVAPPSWRELGERRVNGRVDRDSIAVGREEGAFSAIQIRVADSSVVIDDIDVVLGNGEVFRPQVRLVFDENSKSRVISLPGERRRIERVKFRYGNLPTGGDARVSVWATP